MPSDAPQCRDSRLVTGGDLERRLGREASQPMLTGNMNGLLFGWMDYAARRNTMITDYIVHVEIDSS